MKQRAPAWALGLMVSVMVSGAVFSQCSRTQNPTSPTPASSAIGYTAIAASDGIGFGGSAPCAPFTECPNGTGYVQILTRRLGSDGRTVTLLNLSIPGSVLSPAIESLQRQLGRDTGLTGNFIDRQTPFVPTSTTHVTIFAGGNDANTIGEAARRGLGGGDVRGWVDVQIRQWGTDLEDLVARIRARAPNARVVALNLPNLAGAPYVSALTPQERSLLQYIAVGLSDRVNALTGRHALVVDLLCDARIVQPSSFASDGFHPNDSGYALMAELALPPLSTGAGAPPDPACASRALVPPF